MKRLLHALLLLMVTSSSAWAVLPNEMLKDPVLEARAREISKNLRCLVCQNQSIDESNAELAADIRRLVRERLVAGDTDQQVIQYMVDRYGDFVLLKPPFKPITYLLWFAPVLLLGSAGLGGFLFFRRHRDTDGSSPPETDRGEPDAVPGAKQ